MCVFGMREYYFENDRRVHCICSIARSEYNVEYSDDEKILSLSLNNCHFLFLCHQFDGN